jgi:hypothetical protein
VGLGPDCAGGSVEAVITSLERAIAVTLAAIRVRLRRRNLITSSTKPLRGGEESRGWANCPACGLAVLETRPPTVGGTGLSRSGREGEVHIVGEQTRPATSARRWYAGKSGEATTRNPGGDRPRPTGERLDDPEVIGGSGRQVTAADPGNGHRAGDSP